MNNPREILKNALSRRTFLAGAGSAAAATLIVGCSSDSVTTTLPPVNTYTDADILNFALNLEYLEAEFYLRAATGSGLSSADTGGTGTVTGGAKITGLTAGQQNILNEIAYDEQAHVRALRATITASGGTPVARPAIDSAECSAGDSRSNLQRQPDDSPAHLASCCYPHL